RSKLKSLNDEITQRKSDLAAELKSQRINQTNNEKQVLKVQLDHNIAALEKEETKSTEVVKSLAEEADRIGKTSSEMDFLRTEIRNDTTMRDNIAGQLNRLKVDLHSPPRIAVYQEAELQKKDVRKQILATV